LKQKESLSVIALKSTLRIRLRQDGLRVWFDEWDVVQADGTKRKSVSELQPSAFSLQPLLRAFGLDWVQLEAEI
jgi:hypothetical protein